MTVTSTQSEQIQTICSICGSSILRKVVRDGLTCSECKKKRAQEYQRKRNAHCKKNGHSMGSCQSCLYLRTCRADLHLTALVPGDGLIIMPLRCFTNHPAYDVEEWRSRGNDIPTKDGREPHDHNKRLA